MPQLGPLIELLKKIDKTKSKCRIVVDHDGSNWFWQVPLKNITASEFCPRDLRPKNEHTKP